MRPEARQWLKIAVSDCELGGIAFKKGMYPQAIYLYCQAIEKALKASQIEFTRTVPKKIHYLDVLAIESRLPIEQQQIVQLKELSRLYSWVRYPEIPFAYQIATGHRILTSDGPLVRTFLQNWQKWLRSVYRTVAV